MSAILNCLKQTHIRTVTYEYDWLIMLFVLPDRAFTYLFGQNISITLFSTNGKCCINR